VAKCDFKLPEDFLLKLSRLGDRTDEITEKALEAGGAVVADKVRGNLESVIGANVKTESRSTGQLAAALGVSPPKLNRDGNFDVKIGFSEPRRGGESNAKIANILEYGKHGQPPKPFLKPAKSASRNDCVEAMKRIFEEEVGKV
jgi:HK97 gp10 family phage protein